MTKFTYGDVVRVVRTASDEKRLGARAWIVGVVDAGQRQGQYYERFPPRPVYTIEFEDGASTDIGESDLEFAES